MQAFGILNTHKETMPMHYVWMVGGNIISALGFVFDTCVEYLSTTPEKINSHTSMLPAPKRQLSAL